MSVHVICISIDILSTGIPYECGLPAGGPLRSLMG